MEHLLKSNFKLVQSIFLNKIVFGICALALTIEATSQSQFPLATVSYLILILSATLFCWAYISKKRSPINDHSHEAKQENYYENLPGWNSSIIMLVLIIAACSLGNKYLPIFSRLQSGEWFLLIIFPFVALFLRSAKNTWIKSIVIGFTWAGMVTVYPTMLHGMQNELNYNPGWIEGLWFVKNFVLMSILSYFFNQGS